MMQDKNLIEACVAGGTIGLAIVGLYHFFLDLRLLVAEKGDPARVIPYLLILVFVMLLYWAGRHAEKETDHRRQ